MRELHVDVETYSPVDLPSCGAYRYAEDSRLLLIAYAFDNDPITVIDVANGEQIPLDLTFALWDPSVRKIAHNANFERTLISAHYNGKVLPPSEWLCTAVWAAYAGLPRALANACSVAGVDAKISAKQLIRRFCIAGQPCTGPEWEAFKDYNRNDVEIERQLHHWMQERYPVPQIIWDEWYDDQIINDRGFLIDVPFVKAAIAMAQTETAELLEEAKQITGLSNPNSVAQLKGWLSDPQYVEAPQEPDLKLHPLTRQIASDYIMSIREAVGDRRVNLIAEFKKWTHKPQQCLEAQNNLQLLPLPETTINALYHYADKILKDPTITSLDKKAVSKMLESATGPRKRLLEIRQMTAKSSVKKYEALLNAACKDGRVRGTLLYYGAHTGRFTGRLFQPQNLPRAKCKDYPTAKKLVLTGDRTALRTEFGSVMECLSSLIRASIIASPGKKLWVSDFGQIEARVAAWLAGEHWIIGTFSRGEDYYSATAARLFHILISEVTKDLRNTRGKPAALLLQYGGWLGAVRKAGVDNLTDEEIIDLIRQWRAACPNIVALWGRYNDAALAVTRGGADVPVGPVTFRRVAKDMLINLPSGRSLIYRNARVEEVRKVRPDGSVAVVVGVHYDAEEKGKILNKELWPGLILENVDQAISRDALTDYIHAAVDSCVLHVHDEIVTDFSVAIPHVSPEWARGLVLETVDFFSEYYRKD